MPICRVCKFSCNDIQYHDEVSCDICGGTFFITEEASDYIADLQRKDDVRYKISSFIKRKILHDNSELYIFKDRSDAINTNQNVYEVDEIIESFPRSIKDIFDQILLNLIKLNSKPGSIIKIKYFDLNAPVSLFFAQDFHVASFYLQALTKEQLIASRNASGDIWDIRIQQAGFIHIAELQRKDPSLSKDVFVALDFKWRDSYEKAIKPTLLNLGFNPVCMLEHNRSEQIDYAINAGIRKSRFIVTDLTHKNRGAYWEAGLGYGMGKIVILCCQNEIGKQPSELVHFDLNHFNIIFYENWDELQEKLKNRIEGDERIAL